MCDYGVGSFIKMVYWCYICVNKKNIDLLCIVNDMKFLFMCRYKLD